MLLTIVRGFPDRSQHRSTDSTTGKTPATQDKGFLYSPNLFNCLNMFIQVNH